MKNLQEINIALLDSLVQDEHAAGNQFLEYAPDIDALCKNPEFVYTRVDMPSSNIDQSFIDQIYISTLLSDVAKIYPPSDFATYYGDDRYIEEEVQELLAYHKLIDETKKILTVREGYFVFTDTQGEFLKQHLLPLFERGLLTLTPDPNLMIVTGPKGNESFYTVPAEFDSKNNLWRAPLYTGMQSEIPLTSEFKNSADKEVVHELMLPFISGISAQDFSMILQDESDLLTALRVDIKKLSAAALQDKKNTAEIYQDMVRPRVDKIHQKFKSISELHSFKVKGVTAFTGVLSLLSLTAGDYMGAASIIVGLGTGTAGLVKFEADYHSEINNLKNDSFYLLWKLKQIKRG